MTKVFLSAGHGGSDPGACAHGLKEADINLQTMLACKKVLEEHGVDVVCSRTKDENDPVYQEVREANASKANLAVSFHANAGGGKGFEGFYYPGDGNGKKLVTLATKEVAKLGQEAHGNPVKNGGHLCFVRDTRMTAVLFESFFVDSSDRFIGDTVAEQRAFGEAYAKAILEYLGIAYKTVQPYWAKNETGWWYRHADGSYTVNDWEYINGRWYHFDDNGYMQTGWVFVNDEWYYLDSSGAMVTGLQQIGSEMFYFADNGKMCKTNDRGALV